MGKCLQIAHLIFYVLTIGLTIAGIALIITVFVSEKWLVADHEDDNEIHYHGLYKDCVYNYKMSRSRDEEDWSKEVFDSDCEIKQKEGHDDLDGEDHRGHSHNNPDEQLISRQNEAHVFKTWNLIMIILLSISGACGIMALLLGCCSSVSMFKPGMCCGKVSTSCWFIWNLLACLLAVAALSYFAIKIYDPNSTLKTERLVTNVQKEEQTKGVSFTYTIIAAVLFGLAAVFGIVCTVLSCLASKHGHSSTNKVRDTHKINYISNTTV